MKLINALRGQFFLRFIKEEKIGQLLLVLFHFTEYKEFHLKILLYVKIFLDKISSSSSSSTSKEARFITKTRCICSFYNCGPPVWKLADLSTKGQIFFSPCTVPTSSPSSSLEKGRRCKGQPSSCESDHQSNCRLYFVLKCSDPSLHFAGTFYLSLPLTHIPAETFEAKQLRRKDGRLRIFFFSLFFFTLLVTSQPLPLV